MKKKTIVTALLMAGIAAGVGTQIHAQDTAYTCGRNHSHMHSAADGCLRTLKEQQAARDAAAKRQAEAAQRQAQATRKQNASITPASNTTVQPEAVSTANANSSQQPVSQTAQQGADTASSPCPYHENCDGIHQHSENCDGTHQVHENCNNGMQEYHHSEGRGQGAHHGNGNDHHGR